MSNSSVTSEKLDLEQRALHHYIVLIWQSVVAQGGKSRWTRKVRKDLCSARSSCLLCFHLSYIMHEWQKSRLPYPLLSPPHVSRVRQALSPAPPPLVNLFLLERLTFKQSERSELAYLTDFWYSKRSKLLMLSQYPIQMLVISNYKLIENPLADVYVLRIRF